jgi:hypothetical protein
LFHPFDFVYSSVFVAVKEDDDFVIIAAMAAAVLSHKNLCTFCGKAASELEFTCQDMRGCLKKMYPLSPSSYNKLHTMLLPWLMVNLKQSSNASKGWQPIVPEIILHGTLHNLAVGSVHELVFVLECYKIHFSEQFMEVLMLLMLVLCYPLSF